MSERVCDFCSQPAAGRFTLLPGSVALGYCKYHMVLLYLGLDLEWTD